MFSFGPRSLSKLASCHADLQKVINRVMEFQIMDFTILEGHRSMDRQMELLATGMTTVSKSLHNSKPSLAVDIAPWPIDWDDKFRFHFLAGLIHAAAKFEGVKIRWGGDWDADMQQSDHKFIDMPHFELKGV